MNAKQKAGQKGGKATVAKHGVEHMSEIGKEGAKKTWELYSLKPVNESQYAMVDRVTGKIVAIR